MSKTKFRDFVWFHAVPPPPFCWWPTSAQAAFRLAAHRFFCASEIRFRAAADIWRGPRLAVPRLVPFAARVLLAVAASFASAAAAVVDAKFLPAAPPNTSSSARRQPCAGQRTWCGDDVLRDWSAHRHQPLLIVSLYHRWSRSSEARGRRVGWLPVPGRSLPGAPGRQQGRSGGCRVIRFDLPLGECSTGFGPSSSVAGVGSELSRQPRADVCSHGRPPCPISPLSRSIPLKYMCLDFGRRGNR